METVIINGEKYVKAVAAITNGGGQVYSVVRTYSAGVFVGFPKELSEDGRKVVIYDSRRLWEWSGANELTDLANNGLANGEDCKISCTAKERVLTDVIETIPVTEKCRKAICSIKDWTYE